MTVVLVVLPEVITHLYVKHTPDLPPLEDDSATSKLPLAHLASLAGSALLLSMSLVIAVRHIHPNRDLTGVLVLLLAVNLPYVISPEMPAMGQVVKIVLANAFVLAVWNTGAPIVQLKWVPFVVSFIGIYSIIGGFVIPDYMMYNLVSEKALVAGWELAGPFGHGNVLGMYCAIAFALVPLIPGTRWQLLSGAVLLSTIVASASRTALVAATVVLAWWLLSCFRSFISIRFAGTVFVSLGAAAMLTFPLLTWDPHAFTDRASIWAAGLEVWRHSPIVGLGVDWFMTDAQATGNVAAWAYVGTGHNLVVDTLVKSGLLGLAVLAAVFLRAIISARAMRVTNQQIACFGFLIAFFVSATTEALWTLLPNVQLFPLSGLIFTILIVTKNGNESMEGHTCSPI